MEKSSRWLIGFMALGGVGIAAAAVLGSGRTREAVIPAGVQLVGTLDRTISTESNRVGDRVVITTAEPLRLAGDTILPAGIELAGEVTHLKGGGRLTGAPELTIRFSRLTVQGRSYRIASEPFRLRGRSSTPETAAEIGGGAVVGGVIGALSGSTLKGAAIGAIIGTGVAIATEGADLVLREGRRLRVELAEPVTVRYRPVRPDRDSPEKDSGGE